MRNKMLVLVIGLFLFQPAFALDSDTEQPAMLDADNFEMDFNTGVRIYRGNVVFRQGSILIECDELVTHLDDEGSLDKAVCVGSPSRFKQRPEGANEDVVGVARKITMDGIEELILLKTQAKVSQGGTQISGRLITYDLATEKVVVKGGNQSVSSAKKGESNEDGDATSEEQAEDQGSSRPSLVIQPRKKKKE